MSSPSLSPASPPHGESATDNVTRRILAVVAFNFIAYLAVGLPLAVVPGFVHGDLGYSAVLAGLAVSIQYLATLLSRPWAGTLCDTQGPKRSVLTGLMLCTGSGVLTLIAALFAGSHWLGLTWLLAARLMLGAGESLVTTGTIAWGISSAGARHTAKVISWNGITTYGALAVGAPVGVVLAGFGGLGTIGVVTAVIAGVALLLARRRPPVPILKGERLPFRRVFRAMTPFGLCLALGSVGFGVITAFITLYYANHGWDHAALALTALGTCFVLTRLVMADAIGRFGGYAVALVSFAVEAAGLAIIWMAHAPWQALAGAAVVGFGFSLVFPALGMEAVKRVPATNRGSALGAYALFLDFALGLTGPVAGLIAKHGGYPAVYLFAALSALAALGLSQVLAVRYRAQLAPAA
ncbi:MFS transporter [Cupriavidus pauculus]|uniref:MFS transporter n=1 Tax=Cupriavidus pauculus TaxID=82633 RepID=UPI0007811E9C|nr:MFS transporter [Cupriavidus pauculus]KAB0601332.1 MFS transporter [Cupriavidus pauculus]MBY4732674.1 MFS transporter [Cupriavidus pauculus]UAL02998.1 MFS transporter [Cupriavidus pauculus]